MKKSVLFLTMIVCFFLLLGNGIFAVEKNQTVYLDDGSCVIYNDDGSYIVISAVESIELTDSRSLQGSKFGKKDMTHYSADGNVVWVYTLRGYFTYESGVCAECTDAIDSYDIENSAWSVSESESFCSGNQAVANATFVEKFLFVTTDTVPVSLTITCDEYGNLS